MHINHEHVPMGNYDLVPPYTESLNERSEDVLADNINSPEIQAIIDRMFEIGIGEQGDPKHPTLVGLAAPQIGINKRIILVGIDALGNGEPPTLQAFINPTIIQASAELVVGREGCFSADRVCGIVDRAESVTVHAFDRQGDPVEITVEGFPARIFQHEIDHLDGMRFPDRITDPAKLHWVPKEQFGEYRENWATWQKLCPPERWQAIKRGEIN
jgi:peptide deformylase